MKMFWALLAAIAVTLGALGCGGGDDEPAGTATPTAAGDLPGSGKPPVTLGTKNFTEQYILGELYAQALEANGWRVELKSDIGSTEVTDRALTSGVIDLYPEYTGTTLSVVKGQTEVPGSADATYEQAKAFYERRGQTLLAPTPFQDRDAIAVLASFARENGGLEETGDLERFGRDIVLGAAPEFRTRFAGLKGLRQVYGLTEMRFRPLPIGANYEALNAGRIQAAGVFTTDGQLASGDYVVLDDPEAIFGFQNVAPVVAQEVLRTQGEEFAATLDAVSAKLTNEAMQKMNAAVALDGEEPAQVAREFLQANGLSG